MPEILVEMDRVVIEGQIVVRPDHMPRSEWMRFWESLMAGYRCPHCSRQIR
jgi:hypothetical protein